MNSKEIFENHRKELGEQYNWYLMLTRNGQDEMPVQSEYHLIYAMLLYRDNLLNVIGRGQDITSEQIEKYFNEGNDKALRESLQQVFQEYFSDSVFEIIKQDLNEKDGWTVKKFMEVHRKDKCRRILSILAGYVDATLKEYSEVN